MRSTLSALVLLIPSLATAQETYTLKTPPFAVGQTHRVSMSVVQTTGTIRLDPFGGQIKDRTSTFASQLTYLDQFLDVDKDKVARFRRKFENATETVNDSNPTQLAIHGKTVLVDHRGGARQVDWEDGRPSSDGVTGDMENALRDGKDKLACLASFEPLPGRPVRVGESWDIDISAIVKDCEAKHGCKLTGATGKGTLKQIYQGAKGPCARVEVNIHVPLSTVNNGDKQMQLNEGSGTFLNAVYDFALGGEEVAYASAMQLHFLAAGSSPEADGTATRIRIDLTVDLKENRSGPR